MTLALFTEDMVDAWFKMRDDVLVASGEPTWASLTQALEHVGQRNLADKIKKDIGNNYL